MEDVVNTVLLDPVTDSAAAYNGRHRLITAMASPELVGWAKKVAWRREPWDPSKGPSGEWHKLPAWATPAVLQRCDLLWVRTGAETPEDLRARPVR